MNYVPEIGKDLGCARSGGRGLELARPPADPAVGGPWTACRSCVEWLFANAARLRADKGLRKERGTP
jgi:hypothetical protein